MATMLEKGKPASLTGNFALSVVDMLTFLTYHSLLYIFFVLCFVLFLALHNVKFLVCSLMKFRKNVLLVSPLPESLPPKGLY